MNCMTFGCMSNVTSHLFAKHAGCRRWHCVSCLASVYHNVYLLECFNASASLIHKISRSRRHSSETTSGTDQAFSVVSIFDMYYHIWYTTRFHSSEMSLEFLLFFILFVLSIQLIFILRSEIYPFHGRLRARALSILFLYRFSVDWMVSDFPFVCAWKKKKTWW